MANTAMLPLRWPASLHSRFNAWRLALDARRRQAPRRYVEMPAGSLAGLSPALAERIAALSTGYGVCFEQHLDRATALENYLYLDVLDQLKASAPKILLWPQAQSQLLDVGCKNFYYVRALAAAFSPQALLGIELEGHRRYRNGHSRSDYAAHYVAGVPGAAFQVADVCDWRQPAAVVSCWYPFISPQTVLTWGLPLSVFDPPTFFMQLARCVAQGGHLFMVNQGVAEWQLAQQWLASTPLRCMQQRVIESPLLPRPASPVVSWWQRQA